MIVNETGILLCNFHLEQRRHESSSRATRLCRPLVHVLASLVAITAGAITQERECGCSIRKLCRALVCRWRCMWYGSLRPHMRAHAAMESKTRITVSITRWVKQSTMSKRIHGHRVTNTNTLTMWDIDLLDPVSHLHCHEHCELQKSCAHWINLFDLSLWINEFAGMSHAEPTQVRSSLQLTSSPDMLAINAWATLWKDRAIKEYRIESDNRRKLKLSGGGDGAHVHVLLFCFRFLCSCPFTIWCSTIPCFHQVHLSQSKPKGPQRRALNAKIKIVGAVVAVGKCACNRVHKLWLYYCNNLALWNYYSRIWFRTSLNGGQS